MTELTNIVPLAARLGIPESAARVYCVLLSEGPCSRSELAALGLVPGRELPALLDRLVKSPLAGATRSSSKSLYYATEPSLAWLSLLTTLAWSRSEHLGLPEAGAELEDARFDALRGTVAEILAIAAEHYEPQDPVSKHTHTRSESALALAKLTCEAILLAATRVRAVSRGPRLPYVSLFWTALTQRIDAGVAYTRIADLDEIVNHGLRVVERDMGEYRIDLRALEDKRIYQRFYLVDTRYLVLQDGETAERTERPDLLTGSVTTHRFKVRRFSERFNAMHEEAVPGRVVVSALRPIAGDLVARAAAELGNEGADWVRSLVEMGKFSTWLQKRERVDGSVGSLVDRALAAGIVREGDANKLIPNYAVDDGFLDRLREGQST